MSAGKRRFAHIFVCVVWGVFPNGVTGAMTAGCGVVYLVRLRVLIRRLSRDLYFAVRSLIFTAAGDEARYRRMFAAIVASCILRHRRVIFLSAGASFLAAAIAR